MLQLQAKFPPFPVTKTLLFDGKDFLSVATVINGLVGQFPILLDLLEGQQAPTHIMNSTSMVIVKGRYEKGVLTTGTPTPLSFTIYDPNYGKGVDNGTYYQTWGDTGSPVTPETLKI